MEHIQLPSTWQDWVFGVGQLLFFIALLPSIFSANKPDWKTSLMTATVLSGFSFTQYTLNLIYGSVTAALVAIGWWILFIQSRKKN